MAPWGQLGGVPICGEGEAVVRAHPGRNGGEGTCLSAPPAPLPPSPPPRVSRLASEKRELEAQLGRAREEALAGRAARQEAESLRGLVRSLELELRQERGLGPRGSGRRSQDCRRLAKEVRGRRGGQGGRPGRRPGPRAGPPRSCPRPAARGGEGV